MRRLTLPFALILAFVLAAWVGAMVAPPEWGGWLDNFHWTLSALGGMGLAWAASRRSQPGTSGHRLRWGTMAALGAYTLGQLVWDLETWPGTGPFVLVAKLAFLALGPIMTLTLLQSWRVRNGTRSLSGVHLDATLMTLGIVMLCLAFYLPLLQAGTDWLEVLLFMLYPATLFGAFSLGLVLALHDAGPVQPGRLATLGLLFAFSWVWVLWSLRGPWQNEHPGTLLNLAFSLVVLGLGYASGFWSWSRHTGRRGWKAAVLVLLPLVGPLAGSVAFVVAVADGTLAGSYWFFALLMAALWVLAVVRQGNLFRELREAQVHRERNTQLEDALSQLKRTQDQLVQSEKLSALGQMIAGITHDLNSPMGAIRSSASLLQSVLKDLPASLEALRTLDAEHLALHQRLTESLAPEAPFLDSRSERALKKRLTELADARGHDLPYDLVDLLVESGLAEREDLIEAVFALTHPVVLLEALRAPVVANKLSSVILQAAERASSVVVSLHHFLRSGGEGARTWVVLAASLQAVLPLFDHHRKHGLRLSTTFADEAVVFAWPDKLTQVWVNLISNAVQAVGEHGSVEVGLRVQGPHAVVTVLDDGPGVPEDVRERIFEPFFTTKAAGEGTGLGLEVCRRVVEELGGTIGLDSQPGRTVFRVELPLAEGL